jgi:phosphate transport system protein
MVTRNLFEQELAKLHSEIVRMGVAVENAIAQAVTALIDQDSALARKVIEEDDIIDDMNLEIERMCIEIIAKQQPVARDLRDVTSALKLITDLERIADHASDISERILALSTKKRVMIHYDLITMAEIAKGMIQGGLDAYVTRNVELAQKIIRQDDRVDELFYKLKDETVHLMKVDSENVEQYLELMMICKYFERIADHAQNVAEWVVFYVNGQNKREIASGTVPDNGR